MSSNQYYSNMHVRPDQPKRVQTWGADEDQQQVHYQDDALSDGDVQEVQQVQEEVHEEVQEGEGEGEGEIVYEELSELEDGYEYDFEYETESEADSLFIPTDYHSWHPFADIYAASDFDQTKFHADCHAFLDTPSDEKLALAVLEPFLEKNPRYATWMHEEIPMLLREALGESVPQVERRYFANEFVPGNKEKSCPHKDECGCWFRVSAEAGIPEFQTGRGRREAMAFAHNIMCEFFMILSEVAQEREELRPYQKVTLWEAVQTIGQDEIEGIAEFWDEAVTLAQEDNDEDDEDEDVEDWRKQDYLEADSDLNEMWTGVFMNFGNLGKVDRIQDNDLDDFDDLDGLVESEDETEDAEAVNAEEEAVEAVETVEEEQYDAALLSDPTANELQTWKILATVGKRALTLSVCRHGRGHLFSKKVSAPYYEFSTLCADIDDIDGGEEPQLTKYIARNTKNPVEQTRLPTRVIDTETYKFEDDKMLYEGNYAVLSHMWTQNGREVLYADLSRTLFAARVQQLRGLVVKLESQIEEAQKKLREADLSFGAGKKRARDRGHLKNLEDKKRHTEEELKDMLDEETSRKHEESKKGKKNTVPAPSVSAATAAATTAEGDKEKKSTPVNDGVTKLLNAIKTARKEGFRYLWMDSCCIDKPNNTELVESISSMGDWYENATICLIYFEDVEATALDQVKETKWAQRGWTLQEVVLSKKALFYNKQWKLIADSTKDSKVTLANICGIPKILASMVCIGKRPDVAASAIMKIASKRRTTRAEDRAYSLMGILGVRLTPMYGEGMAKSISRLVETILRTTGDVSVFNWVGFDAGSPETGRSMFPVDFSGFTKVVDNSKPLKAHSALNLGHIGLHARFDVWRVRVFVEGDNEKAIRTLERLEAMHAAGGHANEDIDCSVQCFFKFNRHLSEEEDVLVKIKVFCPMSKLRQQLIVEQMTEPDAENAPSNWVMARFAGVEGANWFLCELGYQSKISQAAMYAEVFNHQQKQREQQRQQYEQIGDVDEAVEPEDAAAGVDAVMEQLQTGNAKTISAKDMSRVMHYLESSGFLARRLATESFPQRLIPTKDKRIQNVNLWIE